MTEGDDLIARLETCPAGQPGWTEFEDVCIDALTFLFVPPLEPPKVQIHNESGLQRRDVIFPNRNHAPTNIWGKLYNEVNARMVLFEFKNYDASEISTEEVNQVRNYMTGPMGKLAILLSNKETHPNAATRQHEIYNQDDGRVILTITSDDVKDMIRMKDRDEDPALVIMEELELFYIKHS